MGNRRRIDDTRAATAAHGAGRGAPAKAVGVVERWKEQLAAGRDLDGAGEPSTDDRTGNPARSAQRHGKDHRGYQGLSDLGVLINLAVLALVCVGGYFLLTKLVEISRQEDCLMGGGRNCAPLQVPTGR
jgi:hypothetical protein